MINYEVEPVLVENIFSDAEYRVLYANINKSPEQQDREVEDTGYIAKPDPTKNYLGDIIKNKIQELSGFEVDKYMVHYARYTLKSNNIPRLYPHYDRGLEFATFTISVILDSTFDWDLFCEGTKIPVKKNQGAFFSGSHQVHWRPPHEFKEDDYYDILVCQFRVKTNIENLTDEHREKMDNKVGGHVSQYYRDYPPFGENGKEWLQEEYIVKDRSITELSESLGMPAEALSYFLRKYEFPMKNK
jgi:hypothetical protein